MAVWLSRSRATIIEGAQAGAVRFDSIPKSSSATPDKPGETSRAATLRSFRRAGNCCLMALL